MFAIPFRRAALPRSFLHSYGRVASTLAMNPNIYSFPSGGKYILTLLPTEPPTPELAIGTTTEMPPTTTSVSENPKFVKILHEVLSEHACEDEGVKAQAQAFASNAGASLGGGGALFPGQRKNRRGDAGYQAGGDGSGATSWQGGAGGGGRGGFIHVSDHRSVPDFGRIAWPEDIFGSLEVDGQGQIEGNGNYQPSGSYRMITREGILGLSDFLRGKVIERLRQEEVKMKQYSGNSTRA